MLEPASRRLLLESLQPPPGCRLDRAVGTTFTLDLIALLAAPVAFAFSDWQGQDGRPVSDPLALLKAVRQYADRICLFGQAGKIHVPRRYQPLLTDLEDSIVEARAPLGGSFHPKLWFLRFVGHDGAVSYRLLCLSRNMTFDRSWDTLLCLEGPLRNKHRAYKHTEPVSQFIAALPGMAVRPLSPEKLQWMEQLAYEIARVEFELPAPFEGLQFWPLGIGGGRPPVLSEPVDRMLVVSPFIDDGFIRQLAENGAPLQLLSRGESLDLLTEASCGTFQNIWVLDNGADVEPGEAEEEIQVGGSPSTATETAAAQMLPADSLPAEPPPADVPASGENPPEDDTASLLGLHAKVFIADRGETTSVLTGSANATSAAFERNIEFLVELKGPRDLCGVAAVLGEATEAGRKRPVCLADLLQPYRRHKGTPETDSEIEQFERLVDSLAQQLAGMAPVAVCADLPENSEAISVTLHSTASPVDPAGCRLRTRPASLSAVHLADFTPEQGEWVCFESVSLPGLTSFFVFDVTSASGNMSRQFVLNVPLENPPADRRERMLRYLLRDRDSVLRFLLLLLMDSGARDYGDFLPPTGNEGMPGFLHSMFDSTLFESLVRALDQDPQRIDQLAGIIADLRKTPEGSELLPENLEAIWGPVQEARRQIGLNRMEH